MRLDQPILDVHGHWGPWFFAMDIGSVQENIRLMDAYGITMQMVSAAEGVVYDAPAGNAALARVLEDQPRLRGYLVVNPNDVAAGERDLQRYLGSDHFVGVKIHTGYPLRAIASPQMRDTFAMLGEYDAVVLIHTWGPDPLDLLPLLADNPTVRVIAGHMGAERFDLAAQAARDCDRIYLEPSCSLTDSARMRHVAAHAPAGQLVFGTDATLIDPAVAFGLVEDAELDSDLAPRVYWQNAAALLGLEDEIRRLHSAPALTGQPATAALSGG